MKTHRFLLLLVLAVLIMGVPANAQKALMAGGGHDVRSDQTRGDLCFACHTPHNALSPTTPGLSTQIGAILWNRSLPAAGGFQVYDRTTSNPDFMGGTVSLGGGTQISLLCLSCHDGTTAMNSIATTTTGGLLNAPPSDTIFRTTRVGATTATAANNLGTDLRNDHPVAFSYDASLAALPTRLKEPDQTRVRLFGLVGSRRMECGSCHDAHGSSSNIKFLRVPNTNSVLCLACHI